MNYYCFDLETATIPQPGQPLNPADGLGVSCAAVCSAAGDVSFWWGGLPVEAWPVGLLGYAQMNEWERRAAIEAALRGLPRPAARMNADEAKELLEDLHALNGPVVTWNGLSFDCHVLAVESQWPNTAADFAMTHTDLMFAFLSVKGYRLGLKAAAEGVGSRKGVEGANSGADAPALWRAGRFDLALAYVAQDVIALRDVAATVIRDGGFSWTAKSGRVNYVSFPRADLEALTVAEVALWPEPDQSWQSEPVNRHDSYRWMPIQGVPTP